MTSNAKSFTAPLLAVAVVTGVIGKGLTAAEAGQSGAVRCEIRVLERGSSVSLEGVVYAKTHVDGSYNLRVSKSGGGGSSNINQGGGFSASPGSPESLGRVSLAGDGSYVARLEVSWNGGATSCSERAGGSL